MRLVLIFFLVVTISAEAQYSSNIMFGIKAGANYSGISHTGSMIVSESYYSGYSLNEKDRLGSTAGIFVNYKFNGTIMAIQPELSYVRSGGMLNYSDINDLKYNIKFNYENIRIGFLVKAYPFGGFNIMAGPCLGYNFSPTNIYYKSNSESIYGPDLNTQQQLRNVLKGRPDFGIIAGIGYEFSFGLSIEACYTFGVSDVIETQINGYRFIENSNKTHSVQLTLGWAISSDGINFGNGSKGRRR